MNDVGIWFAAIGVILTNLGSVIGVLKYFNSRFENLYRDLDVYKKEADTNYVRKDLCKVMHEQSALNIMGLETRLNSRIDKMEEKQDKMLDLLTHK